MDDKYSLTGKVYKQIKSNILTGKYADGSELRELTIGEELGVSRTPVREALKQLEMEGLVNIYPNRGAYVKGITTKDVEDIYRIRARLEGLCAAMAAEVITNEQVDHLDEIILLTRFYEQKEDIEHLVSLDSQFHEQLYESCGSKILEHQLKDYHQYVQQVRRRSLQRQKRAHSSTEEHAAILEAVKSKNAALADELATRHILNTIENLKQGNIS